MKSFLTATVGLSIVSAAVIVPQPAQAQIFPPPGRGCQYLREVTTRQTQIRKLIATNNSNANTDFVVPPGIAFTRYLGMMVPENNARYTAEANLKYADNTSSTVANRTLQARRFYLYQLPFRTPTAQQPFQVNARITGDRNTAYRIAIQACQ